MIACSYGVCSSASIAAVKPPFAIRHIVHLFAHRINQKPHKTWTIRITDSARNDAQIVAVGTKRRAASDYLNNRYHDPTLGRFTSVDPLVSVTHDAYGYGNNNPITYSDPSGLEPCGLAGNCTSFDYEGPTPGRMQPSDPFSGVTPSCAAGQFDRCNGPQTAWPTNRPRTPQPQGKVSGGDDGGLALGMIANEMHKNRNSGAVAYYRDPRSDAIASLALYYGLFKTGGKWDHKKRVDAITGGADWVLLGPDAAVRWDTLSNLHYGYIMAASGESLEETLDFSHIKLSSVSNGTSAHSQSDDRAIEIGFKLYSAGADPSLTQLRSALLDDGLLRSAGGSCVVSRNCYVVHS
jgi:RHS repeat-associated protein